MADLAPLLEEPITVRWLRAWKTVAKPSHKGFDTLFWLVAWSFRKKRNRHVHEQAALQPVALVSHLVLEKQTKCIPICMLGSSFMHIVDISE
jgi:hypothetical protein